MATLREMLLAPEVRPQVVKAYKSVRGSASKHIETALPNLGAMVQKYAI